MAEIDPQTLYVRIKPFNKRRGHVVKQYKNRRLKLSFQAGRWHRVTPSVAEQLERTRQDHTNPDSPCIFDICTKAEADAILDRETEAAHASRRPILPDAITVPPEDRAAFRQWQDEQDAQRRREEIERLPSREPNAAGSEVDQRLLDLRARYTDLSTQDILTATDGWGADLLEEVLALEKERTDRSPRKGVMEQLERRIIEQRAALKDAAETGGAN